MNKKKTKKTPKPSVKRVVSSKTIKPTAKKCNARLTKRDGYCTKPPMSEGSRCKHHNGQLIDNEAKGIYKAALNLDQASQLEAFLRDTESMSGEISISKIELVGDIKQKQKLLEMYEDLLNSYIPPPTPVNKEIEDDLDRFKEEMEAWNLANDEKNRHLKEIKRAYENVNERIMKLSDNISKAVERNNKVLHGKKYTVSIQQLTEVLHVQIGAFEKYCKGCPKLKNIVMEFQNMKLKGIGSIKDISSMTDMPKNIKKEYSRKVKEMEEENIRKMEEIAEDMEDVEYEELEE